MPSPGTSGKMPEMRKMVTGQRSCTEEKRLMSTTARVAKKVAVNAPSAPFRAMYTSHPAAPVRPQRG